MTSTLPSLETCKDRIVYLRGQASEMWLLYKPFSVVLGCFVTRENP